jgi:hypothetical protein
VVHFRGNWAGTLWGNSALTIRLVEKGIGYGIIPERAVNLSGAKLIKSKHLPTYEDVIGIIYRPEFGKNLFEKEVINSIVNVF